MFNLDQKCSISTKVLHVHTYVDQKCAVLTKKSNLAQNDQFSQKNVQIRQ